MAIFDRVPEALRRDAQLQLVKRSDERTVAFQKEMAATIASARARGFGESGDLNAAKADLILKLWEDNFDDLLETQLPLIYEFANDALDTFKQELLHFEPRSELHGEEEIKLHKHWRANQFERMLASIRARNYREKHTRIDNPPALTAQNSNVTNVEFKESIGMGVSANVWRAFEPSLQREIAIKLLSTGGNSHARIIGHAIALAKAAHPNVVTVHYTAKFKHPESNEIVEGIAMELLSGRTLAERLHEDKFSVAELKAIGSALLNGLEHMHSKQLAHGDLHEGNVMISGDIVKILDIAGRDALDELSTIPRETKISRDLTNVKFILGHVLQHSQLELPINEIQELREANSFGGVRVAFEKVTTDPIFRATPSEYLKAVSALLKTASSDTEKALARALRVATADLSDLHGLFLLNFANAVRFQSADQVESIDGLRGAHFTEDDLYQALPTFTKEQCQILLGDLNKWGLIGDFSAGAGYGFAAYYLSKLGLELLKLQGWKPKIETASAD